MSTSRDIRNARVFARAQQCYDDRLPPDWSEPLDAETFESVLDGPGGESVTVVWQWWAGFPDVIGLLQDGVLIENMTPAEKSAYEHSIAKEQSCTRR